ncbi:divergent polysaccharide deacetylase family protein [Chthonobacter rhizosphaerae]|uniref:divergent polysaccharide deacetylase family protein n=1 Tax=Chthonobacter rhizosphaerae TaxID=2735553 RepID=UPI0015EFCF9C|nr:divergent polysaccharide deacetylase family protein [Chthonobacter rhizosphaerae]
MSDLTSPLGYKPPPLSRKTAPVGMILASVLVALAALVVLWVVVVDDPHGGEPVAVAEIEDGGGPVQREDVTVVGVKSGSGEILPSVSEPAPEDAIETVDVPQDTPAAAPRTIATAPDPDLLEETAFGALPKVSASGLRPLDAYARPVPSFVGTAPKIAVVIGGLGLSQTGTQEALRLLPPDVTLGFAPYGSSLDRWVAKAREGGHELLLQIPMEPYDYPDNDPGPHTLLTTLDKERNRERLHWLLGRISLYVGVQTYMGARFTAEGPALEPVIAEIARRGLLFVDEGSSSRSTADQVAATRAAPFAKADLIIDAIPSEADITGRLTQLEQIARSRGFAVGTASALPVTVREVAEWARTLDARGITLVPISATQAMAARP